LDPRGGEAELGQQTVHLSLHDGYSSLFDTLRIHTEHVALLTNPQIIRNQFFYSRSYYRSFSPYIGVALSISYGKAIASAQYRLPFFLTRLQSGYGLYLTPAELCPDNRQWEGS
jgi:hypothetical protein